MESWFPVLATASRLVLKTPLSQILSMIFYELKSVQRCPAKCIIHVPYEYLVHVYFKLVSFPVVL